MTWQEIVGLVAGLLTTLAFFPQVWRLFKLKSTYEISLSFTLLFACGVMLWLIYGILFRLLPVILWNAITLCFALTILYAKVKYEHK